jgi:RimJ/RimL family protein N-acetyltransferase
VREIRAEDAENLLALQHRLDEETTMMMLEPGERGSSMEPLRSHVCETLASPGSTIIVAESDSRLVGYVEAEGGRYRRTRHSAQVVIGVLRAYQGCGIGHSLLVALRTWAAGHDVVRLELTVRADNEPARRLYERVGFAIEGVRRGSLRVDGQMIDELSMALVLSTSAAAAGSVG